MRRQDLRRLPLGTQYELRDTFFTDLNYKYILSVRKKLCEDGYKMFDLKEVNSNQCIFLIEDEVNEDGEYRFWEGAIKYRTMAAHINAGGVLSIHTKNTYDILRYLEFIPRGSFDVFAERVKEFNHNLFICPNCRERVTFADATSKWCEKCGNTET